MITATATLDGPAVVFNVTAKGLAVYLDNWALYDLAEGDPTRRKRFVEVIRTGGDLIFSVTNAVELSGAQGRSANLLRIFLDEIGPHWFPVELNPLEVVQREQDLMRTQGSANPGSSCICKRFVNDYFADRFADCSPGSGKIIDLSPEAFGLGSILNWLGPQYDSIRRTGVELDAALKNKIQGCRTEVERDPAWLDIHFPVWHFRPDMPATFVYINLMRDLVLEVKSHPLKANDGKDFCHAILACAFSSVATLDTHWQRRVENLPQPHELAPIYSSGELDEFVDDVEMWVSQMPVQK